MATSVGFGGLGHMGLGIATNLQRHLRTNPSTDLEPTLRVWNRSKEKAAPLTDDAELGSVSVADAGDLAECGTTFLMLLNDDAVEAVVAQYLSRRRELPGGGPTGAAIVDCSTVLPSTTTRLVAAAAEAGVSYCACPVWGRPDAAAAGRLMACLAGGNAGVRLRLRPLVESFAQRTVWELGDDPAAAHAAKLTGNHFIMSQIQSVSEVLALGGKNGVPADVLLGIMDLCLASPAPGVDSIPMGYAKRISAGQFNASAGFTVESGLKDVGHMRELGASSACPLPMADLAYNRLLTAKAKFGGDLDWSAVALAVRDAAGMETASFQK